MLGNVFASQNENDLVFAVKKITQLYLVEEMLDGFSARFWECYQSEYVIWKYSCKKNYLKEIERSYAKIFDHGEIDYINMH